MYTYISKAVHDWKNTEPSFVEIAEIHRQEFPPCLMATPPWGSLRSKSIHPHGFFLGKPLATPEVTASPAPASESKKIGIYPWNWSNLKSLGGMYVWVCVYIYK
jgi:hypothetical protein